MKSYTGFLLALFGIISLYGIGVYLYMSGQGGPRSYHEVRPRESFAEPSECTTPFGTLLGIANNTPAFSNCRRGLRVQWVSYFDFDNPLDVSDPQDSTLKKKHMMGNRYLALDFVMRWLAHNRGVALMGVQDIDVLKRLSYFYNPVRPAQEWDAEYIANPRKGHTRDELIYLRPRVGDILLYTKDNENDLQDGHMAVIVGVKNDIEGAGGKKKFKELLDRMVPPRIIYLAEQNFDNTPWKGENYSRIVHFRWVMPSTEGAPEGFIEDPSGAKVFGRLRIGKPRVLHVEEDPNENLDDDL